MTGPFNKVWLSYKERHVLFIESRRNLKYLSSSVEVYCFMNAIVRIVKKKKKLRPPCFDHALITLMWCSNILIFLCIIKDKGVCAFIWSAVSVSLMSALTTEGSFPFVYRLKQYCTCLPPFLFAFLNVFPGTFWVFTFGNPRTPCYWCLRSNQSVFSSSFIQVLFSSTHGLKVIIFQILWNYFFLD